ncbi:chromate efflux transporter [Leptospira ryugenii]|uniref:chromate efflux transporter n=1 Tax=Leptospira ryugenii TaxID=1917863 RepID=UPI000D594E4B|nr:chromate efflux transporter [Leptospira ryugenii]
MKYTEILFTALRLGLTSFGGPIAHLAYFREVYVQRKKWISESDYLDLISLCQVLPGPASSQVGLAIGFIRGGYLGSILAWIGFTLPSALFLCLCAMGINSFASFLPPLFIHSLKVGSVAVILQAIVNMSKQTFGDHIRIIIALCSSILLWLVQIPFLPMLLIFLSGFCGYYFGPQTSSESNKTESISFKQNSLFFFLILTAIFFLLMAIGNGDPLLSVLSLFYRTGFLVFGGGHVVLPLLQDELVSNGLLTKDLFLAGYGLANIVPGPLFSFSAFVGFLVPTKINSWLSATLCTVFLFIPSFLLIWGTLPNWEKIKSIDSVKRMLYWINASVLGFLIAALYDPIWKQTIESNLDISIATLGFVFLEQLKFPSWLVVLSIVMIYNLQSIL